MLRAERLSPGSISVRVARVDLVIAAPLGMIPTGGPQPRGKVIGCAGEGRA
jgi:hypothetical protein